MRHPRTLLVALAVAGSLTLAGCADGDPGASGEAGDHNAQDVAFASDMVVHHSQALEMVELADGRALDPAVSRLARDIEAAQAPEIEQMTGWLTAWGEPVPMAGESGGHDTSDPNMDMDMDMPGAMDQEVMATLEQAPDERFQRLWLTAMIEHHRGAVSMAKEQVAEGAYGPAVEVARGIVRTQTDEIATMSRLLGKRG